jgi:hypothetical protein
MSGDPRPASGEATGAEPLPPPTTDAAVIPAQAGVIPAPETETETGADAQAVATGATAQATAPAALAAPIDAAPAIGRARRRGLAIVAALTRILRFALAFAILGVGIAFGYQSFLSSQPLPTGPVSDPVTAGNQPAPVVREFIAAVASNDADLIRSAVPADPYKSFTSEMARWEFQEVTSVETLATHEDGPRTATAFVMIGRDNAGNPVAINLVVQTEGGNIVAFR